MSIRSVNIGQQQGHSGEWWHDLVQWTSQIMLLVRVLIKGGRRSPAVACWASDHWVASSNPLRGRVVWFKSFDLNHWFKSWFKSLQKNQKNHVFLIFLIFINILSIIINILLIFNDKFVCMFIILQSCETIITCIENYIIISYWFLLHQPLYNYIIITCIENTIIIS